MRIVTGVDIVDVARFEKVLESSGKPFLERVFFETEYANSKTGHLAGIFAAKEAVKKAFDVVECEVWKKIEIRKRPSGKPEIVLYWDELEVKIMSSDVSISHDGGTAAASFVAIIE
ncbi:MAG TPA: holo-ACP synthase [Patescibacteria group bacterium]